MADYTYKAEMKQLLHLLVHSLYTHPEVFLRELISNASDALNKARFYTLTHEDVQSASAPLHIKIEADADAQTLSITDTGIGMTQEDLIERIGTVASSGTLAFLEQMQASDAPLDAQMIGQFGVGFYSAFMVAREIVIETRHADPNAQGYRWNSDGEGTFSIDEIDKVERGTTVILHLKDDAKEFAQPARIRQVIRRYSNFVDFPIYVDDEQANTVKALWRMQKSEVSEEDLNAFYSFITNDPTEPLGHLHLSLEGRVSFKALLFIPAQAPPDLFREEFQRKLHLYANNVFIRDDAEDLLPEYLRFVRGVVDTEDLPLNVSREVTQSSPIMARLRGILTNKVLGLLEDWAKTDPEKYTTFFREFGPLFKTAVGQEFTHRDRITELLRFETTATEPGDLTSFAEYASRLNEDQKAIYYALGDHRDVLERNPKLEYFKKHDLEVLLLTHPVDVFTIPGVGAYNELPLQSIEKADLDLDASDSESEETVSGETRDRLLARFKKTLGDRVEDVVASKRLVDSAATLVTGSTGLDPQMERMMRLMNQDLPASARILELNLAHPLLRNLARLLDESHSDELLTTAIHQLYEGAQLLEGTLTEPTTFIERMTTLMEKATTQ